MVSRVPCHSAKKGGGGDFHPPKFRSKWNGTVYLPPKWNTYGLPKLGAADRHFVVPFFCAKGLLVSAQLSDPGSVAEGTVEVWAAELECLIGYWGLPF